MHMNLSNYFFRTYSIVLIHITCSLLAPYFMDEIRETVDVRFMTEASSDKCLTLNFTDISQWNYNFHTTTQQSPRWLQWDAPHSPQNCYFPFNDHHQNLIHPYQARCHSSPQTVSGSNQMFCHSSFLRIDRWATWMFCNKSAPLTVLIESDNANK